MRSFYILFIAFYIISNVSIAIKAQSYELDLWKNGIPGSIINNDYTESSTDKGGWYRVSQVTNPTIKVYLPKNVENKRFPAILICPGGGYGRLAMDHEGFEVAEWLNSLGIAGIVLKYRLPSDAIMEDKSVGPLQDAQQAMRIIRKNASEWNIDSTKIGVMGFSAGGHLASTLVTQFNKPVYDATINFSAHPDFGILVYPVISMSDSLTHLGSRKGLIGEKPSEELIKEYSNELQVGKETPSCFVIHSSDDSGVNYLNSIRFYEALTANGIPSELHIYDNGGHGYGLAMRKAGPNWTPALEAWLKLIFRK